MQKYIRKLQSHYQEYGLQRTIAWFFSGVVWRIKKYRLTKPDYGYDQSVKPGFIPKTKRIFILGTIPFYDIGGGQRSAQLAKTFHQLGYEVFYIYAFKSSDSKVFGIDNPCSFHKHIESFQIQEIAPYVTKDSLFIFEAPCTSFLPYLELAKKVGAKTIYENIDNWENAELGGLVYSAEALEAMIRDSDILTCTARPLIDQTKQYLKKHHIKKDILYVANAVDDTLFDYRRDFERPDDLAIGEKTLLYYGSLWGTWFDWNAVFSIAQSFPTYTINLIGDYHGILEKVKDAPENVKFLGLKSQTALPAYLAYSDFAILPFKVDDIGKYVSPLKIFEYIAMGKQVIATKLPDITGYPNVDYAEKIFDWERALRKFPHPNLKAVDAFVAENNWFDRASKLLAAADPQNAKTCSSEFAKNLSVIVLNYNNSNVIFRCIDSLLHFKSRYQYEIIIVDNQSTDGSYEELRRIYKNNSDVHIYRNTKNGCSSGRNLGVKKSTKDYVLFLDSDQWITNPYWLDNYFELFQENPDKLAIGWGAGWFNNKMYSYKIAEFFPFAYIPPKYLGTTDVGYIGTAGFLMKKSLFNKIGGFDEAYDPTCYEDTDLSLAIRHAGGETIYSKALGVGHLPHQTTKSGTKGHADLLQQKGDYFVAKWRNKNPQLITKHRK